MKQLLVAILIVLSVASPVNDITIEEYLKHKDDIKMKLFVAGLEKGIFMENIRFFIVYEK